MRKKLIAGNWKMNLDWNEAMTLMAELMNESKSLDQEKVELAVFPPFPYLRHFHELLHNEKSEIKLGSQDCSEHAAGAYTGEVSSSMLKSVGAVLCLVGHSERREYHRETNDVLCGKVEAVLAAGLAPVFCCGENLTERENDNHTFVIDNQLDGTIFELSEEQFSKVIIAYEPVWAIGTGRTASSEQAQEMHEFIRSLVQSKYGKVTADNVRILYGGSVKPDNASELFSQPDVDGGLIGGASLKCSAFMAIANAVH
jgi:triosephosphate isomerase (TIM)